MSRVRCTHSSNINDVVPCLLSTVPMRTLWICLHSSHTDEWVWLPHKKKSLLLGSMPAKCGTPAPEPSSMLLQSTSLKCNLAEEVHNLVNKRILSKSLLESCPSVSNKTSLLPPVSLLASLTVSLSWASHCTIPNNLAPPWGDKWSIYPESWELSHLEDWQVLPQIVPWGYRTPSSLQHVEVPVCDPPEVNSEFWQMFPLSLYYASHSL